MQSKDGTDGAAASVEAAWKQGSASNTAGGSTGSKVPSGSDTRTKAEKIAAKEERRSQAYIHTQKKSTEVYIGGLAFSSVDAVTEYLRNIKTKKSGKLNVKDSCFMVHLAMLNPKVWHSITAAITKFRVCDDADSKNELARFEAVLEDGSTKTVDIESALTFLKSKTWDRPAEKPREPAREPPRERKEPSKTAAEDATQKPAYIDGRIVEIKGLKDCTNFSDVKKALEPFAPPGFVDIMKIPPSALKKMQEEDAELRTSDEEADAAKEKKKKSADGAEDEAKTDAGAGEDKDATTAFKIAHCRFTTAEDALKVVEGLKEILGAKVTATVMNGAAEAAYWRRYKRQRDRRFSASDRPAKKPKKE